MTVSCGTRTAVRNSVISPEMGRHGWPPLDPPDEPAPIPPVEVPPPDEAVGGCPVEVPKTPAEELPPVAPLPVEASEPPLVAPPVACSPLAPELLDPVGPPEIPAVTEVGLPLLTEKPPDVKACSSGTGARQHEPRTIEATHSPQQGFQCPQCPGFIALYPPSSSRTVSGVPTEHPRSTRGPVGLSQNSGRRSCDVLGQVYGRG